MQKRIYLPYTTSIVDLGIGPSRFALNDEVLGGGGDAHSMKMSLYKRDFMETREEVAKKMNLPTTDPLVRAGARFIVRHEHYEPDLRASQTENSGALEYETERRFAIVNGEVTFLNSDGAPSKYTLSGFHKRVADDNNPDVRNSYSEEAHKLDLLVQSTIVSAKNRIEVTKFAHDVKGIRDAYTLIYDPVTNRGKIRVRNMAPDGNFLSVEEAQQRMRGLFKDKNEIHVEKNVFILTDAPSESKSTILSTYEHFVHKAIGNTIDEIKATGSAVIDYIDRKINQEKAEGNVQVPLEHLRELSATGLFAEIFSQKEENKALQALTTEGIDKTILQSMTEEDIVTLWLQRAEEVLSITPEQSQALLGKVEEAWQITTGAREIIQFAVDPQTEKVAIPAALFALQVLAHPEMFLQEQDGASEEDFIVVSTQLERDAIFAFFSSTNEEIILKPNVSTESISGLPSVDTTVLIWTREVIQLIDQLSPEEAIKIIDHKKEVVLVHMSELLEVFQELFGQKTIQEGEKRKQPFVDSYIKAAPEFAKLERESVEQFTFAYAFWLLLKLDSYYRSLATLKDFIMLQDRKVDNIPLNLLTRLKVQMPEGLVRKEVGVFILAAIIWHLAQKREAGMYQSPNPKKTVKKKRKTYIKSFVRPLPQTGILFASQ